MLYSPTFLAALLVTSVVLVVSMFGLQIWMRERRREAELRAIEQAKQDERETKRLELEERRLEAQEQARYEAGKLEEDRVAAGTSGAGSGGYIVVDMPEKERPLFHDLLKGFEDYAKLKGYHISFSIDASVVGRIAFKFTVRDDGFVVGAERVRRDFVEYVNQVRAGKVEDLDNLPVITSLEEHNLLVTILKNRISFLKNSYEVANTTAQYYAQLIANVRSFPALPAPSVIVQTGGTMDSRKYNATNSSRLIQGDSNTYADSSVNIDIGNSFNQKQERIAALDDLITKLKSSESQDEPVVKAQRELGKVRDELAEYPEPDKSAVKKWMEYAKQLLTTATLRTCPR